MQKKKKNWDVDCNKLNRKTPPYFYEQNMNTQNYLKVLEETIEEMKELRDISRDVLFLLIDNARYHWSMKHLNFFNENNIKIIDWLLHSPDLNPIENIWTIMKRKIAGKTFTNINNLKINYISMETLDDEMIMKTWMSIYGKMNDCIKAKWCLTNYLFNIHFINIILILIIIFINLIIFKKIF